MYEKATSSALDILSSVLCVGCAQQDPVVTENGLVCIMSADTYKVSGSIGALLTGMTSHDIAVDTFSAFNIIAPGIILIG